MKTIKQSYLVNAPQEKVWQALTDPKVINKWGGGPAKISGEEGVNFSFWGGDIHGKNIEVINPPAGGKKLVQDWKEKDWDQFSKVTFTLSEKGGKTRLNLVHEDVPDEKAEDIDDGWKRYYLGPLKELLEK